MATAYVPFPYIDSAGTFSGTVSSPADRIIPDNADDYLLIVHPEAPGYIQVFKYEEVWIEDSKQIRSLVIANANSIKLAADINTGSVGVTPLKQLRFKSCEIAAPISNAAPIYVTLANSDVDMIIEPGATLRIPVNNNQVVPPFVITYDDADAYNIMTSPEYNTNINE